MSRRIAIVEDDPAIRANYADALRKHGFEISAYGSRPEALAAMKARLPDLAIIDIGLGADVDGGFELCRELRALSAALPITWSPLIVYFGITIILGLLDWTGLARAVRSKLLAVREEDFVSAAVLMGARPSRVMPSRSITPRSCPANAGTCW